MFLELTPKDWFMMQVGLVFQAGDPDPEDAWVRSYLREQQLVPRRQMQEERDGVPCEVLYFGQCYLGRHLHTLQQLYRRGIERSLLLQKLRDLRQAQGDASISWPVELTEPAFDTLLPALAEALHESASFSVDENGHPAIALDPALITSALDRLMINPPASPASPPS
jgi:hypothetical protein